MACAAAWGQETPPPPPQPPTSAASESGSRSTNAVPTAPAEAIPSDRGTNAPTASQPDAKTVDAGATHDYRSFQVIADRNIFNPNRSRRSRGGPGEGEPPKPPQIDIIALSGTIQSARGQFAFFDSNASAFRKAVRLGDPIAGYTLREVQQTSVALEREKESIRLKVGEQLRREDEGEWRVTRGETFTSSSGETSGGSGPSAPGASTADAGSGSASTGAANSGGGEGASDALKRLLEKRRKEQSQ